MKKHLFSAFFLSLFVPSIDAQQVASQWSDLFSYNNIIIIREDNGKLITAANNGLFYYTPATGEITKLSKANGLHEVNITAFDYNPETKTGLVGYSNGSLDVITESGITYVLDIPNTKSFTGNKSIKHISITGNQAVISVDYGVSIFNLDRKEFGETAFFTEKPKEAVIKDNVVYALTDSGIKKHEINTTFPIYSSWETALAGAYNHIDIENGTIAIANSNQAMYGDGTNFSSLGNFTDIKDISISTETILVTYSGGVSAYSLSGVESGSYTTSEDLNTAWWNDGKIYAGSTNSGILAPNSSIYKPDGPYDNKAYKLHLQDDKIWVSTGAREDYNTAVINSKNLGFYFFNGLKWIYPSLFIENQYSDSPMMYNVVDVIANPSNTNEVFFANYTTRRGQGIYKVEYDQNTENFVEKQEYLLSQGSYDRPVGFAYDDKNNLFVSLAFYNNTGDTGYGVYDTNKDTFIYKSIPNIQRTIKPLHYDGILLVPGARNGSLGIVNLNDTPSNLSDDTIKRINSENGLPATNGTLSVSVDKNGDAWIGSYNGLRVINSITSNLDNPQANPIIIEQNGLGEELFRDSQIIQITTDSANNKWISVDGGGVFYMSANGQTTLKHFTKENSPLPNNTVTDIKVDEKTGKVYFATYDGIVVYQGDVASVNKNFGNVLVYPNPVISANYKGNVKIKGLAEKTNIRIVDTAGNLVHQAVTRNGFYEWDLTNKGKRVASGIYFVLMTNEDGTDKATAKIAVVN